MHSLPPRVVPSPDGTLIATLQQSCLRISTYGGASVRSISLAANVVSKCRFIQWQRFWDKVEARDKEDPQTKWQCSRILLADDDMVRVYDIDEPHWSAVIERASSSLGSIADVAFGHTCEEVLVFSDFGVKLTIWSLVTSRGIEIRDPKYMAKCYDYRPKTGHMAILTRPAAQDILMLLNPEDHLLVKSVELSTVDAQEVDWSPDGRWLAIRDAASTGSRMYIYTADGHLFKTYLGAATDDGVELGIKSFAWDHSMGFLAVGDYNHNVTMLGKNTFSPFASFHHPTTILLPNVALWQEQLDANDVRTYDIAPQPASLPSSNDFAKMASTPRGVSIIAFSADSSFVATKDDSVPTTVWIWSLHKGTAIAALIHHSPVKQIAWHPTEPGLLLLQCLISQPCVHVWKSTWDAPRVVTLPLSRTGGKFEANWLHSPEPLMFNIYLSSTHQYIIGQLSNSGELLPQHTTPDEGFSKSRDAGVENLFDEGNSLDLSPIKITRDETIDFEDGDGSVFGMDNEMVDDTFHYRRHVRALG